jgi:putative nucleotidyltransferase with HDIG domain
MKFTAVILAAGYSSRIGGFKPLMELGGHSLIGRCAGLFRRAGIDDIVLITGHRHEEVEAKAARLGLSCIHNLDYDQGMYSSVCTAAAHLHLTKADGFFMLPVDIPLIRPATIAALSAAFAGRAVLYPSFAGLRGHPPLIPAHLIPAILAHDGRGGLKSLLETREHLDVAVWDKGILLDADTPEDFGVLTRREARLTIGDPAEALALARLTMPEQGVAHGLAVARIAGALGQVLNCHGCRLDMDLLHNGALLHDIGKGRPQHEAWGAELLTGLGLEKPAEIVAAHRDARPPVSGRLTEKEVVCLADKLVRGTLRVSVQQRFAEKLEIYAEDHEACRAIRARQGNALALQTLVERTVGRSIEEILDSEPDR